MSIVVTSCLHAHFAAPGGVTDDLPNVVSHGRPVIRSSLSSVVPGTPRNDNESIGLRHPPNLSGALISLPIAGAGVTPEFPTPDARSSSDLSATSPTASGFEGAILPHLDAAYNLARWLMRDSIDAEDVVQEACLRALQYFASFRGDNGRAWLLHIVRNTAYARIKARRRGVEIALGSADEENRNGGTGMDVADPEPGPEAALATSQDSARVKAAVAALPIDLRECIILRETEELSYKEIAQITQISIGTVMSRLHRARRRLKALLTT